MKQIICFVTAISLLFLQGCKEKPLPPPIPPVEDEYTAYFVELADDAFDKATLGFTYVNPLIEYSVISKIEDEEDMNELDGTYLSMSFSSDESLFLPAPIYDGMCVSFAELYDGDEFKYDQEDDEFYIPRGKTHIVTSPDDIGIVFWIPFDESTEVFADVDADNRSALLNHLAYIELDTVPEWYDQQKYYIYDGGVNIFGSLDIMHYRLTRLDREYFDNLIPVRDSLHAEQLLEQYGKLRTK